MTLIAGFIAFATIIGLIIYYAIKEQQKQEQAALIASAELAEACVSKEPEIAEEAVKVELAIEPKIKPVSKKKSAKKKAKKTVKKNEAISELAPQTVIPKPRKSRTKNPVA